MAKMIALNDPRYSWNPLAGYPRNATCFCGGFQKAKKCCLPILPKLALTKEVPAMKLAVKRAEAGDRVAIRFTRIEDEAFDVMGHEASVIDKITPAVQSVVHVNSGAEVIETKRVGFFANLVEKIKGAIQWVLRGQRSRA